MNTEDLEHQLREAIVAVLHDTPWAPPDGAILTDAVVVLGWYMADGAHAACHFRCGSPWATHGLMIDALDRIEQAMEAENAPDED